MENLKIGGGENDKSRNIKIQRKAESGMPERSIDNGICPCDGYCGHNQRHSDCSGKTNDNRSDIKSFWQDIFNGVNKSG